MLLKTQIQNSIYSLWTQPFIILKSSSLLGFFLGGVSTLSDINMTILAFFRLVFKFLVSTCICIKYVSWKQNLDFFVYNHLDTIDDLFYWSICPLHLIQIITFWISIYYLTICYLFIWLWFFFFSFLHSLGLIFIILFFSSIS